MTTFHLIRHAERSGDQEMLAGRLEGFHLTLRGRAQAEALARMLASQPISRVFSSPLERARETAAPLARERGVTVKVLPALGEVDMGQWTGRKFRELDEEDAQWRRFNRLRGTTRIPGGESAVQIQARFVGEMLRLHEEFPDSGIALVSHADPIKIALAAMLGAPLDFYDRLEIELASVSVVALDPAGVRVLRLNSTAPQLAP